MISPTQPIETTNYQESRTSWWSKLVAVVALVNLLLVFFNLSYVSLRDIYLQHFPPLVRLYDTVKGIEPHPDTTLYLDTVNTLEKQLTLSGLESQPTENLLGSLRQQSLDIIAENPFLDANKYSAFAQLKRLVEYHFQTRSSEEAFATLWSQEYLAQVSPQTALDFFDRKIRPILAKNYFRNVDENGLFIDRFWQIDLGFAVFFGIEFLTRSWRLSVHQKINYFDAMLRRWYDGLLFLPTWRWLRVIPVSVRVYQSRLINLERLLAQITHEPAAYLAERVSLFLMVRLINQTQEAIDEGEAARLLLQPKPYKKVNEVDEVDAIIDRILQLAIYKVIPQVQPDMEALLRYSLKGAFKESDFYQSLEQIPGFKEIPTEVTENLADYLSQTVYDVLASSYADVQGRVLFDNLSQRFKKALRRELQDREVQAELQSLLSNLLEEIKLNYIQSSTEEDPELTLSQAEQARQEVEGEGIGM